MEPNYITPTTSITDERVLNLHIGSPSSSKILFAGTPHARAINQPKLCLAICKCFPDEELIEIAAKLLALYKKRYLLSAEIDLLKEDHPEFERAKDFKSYFRQRDIKDAHNETKFERGFRRLFLTHEHQANDPSDCYTLDNPQVKWYYKVCNKIFSHEARRAVEEEFQNQFEKINFVCNSVEWAYFYKNLPSHLELHVTRKGYGYPSAIPLVVVGIFIACKWSNSTCSFTFADESLFFELCEHFPKLVRDYILSTNPCFYTTTISSLNSKPGHDDASNLYNIKDYEDINKLTNSDTSASLRRVFLKHCVAKVTSASKSCNLESYLSSIGYPSLKVNIKDVLDCSIGSYLVSQLTCLHRKGLLEQHKIIPNLLKLETKRQSKFWLNSTKTFRPKLK